MGCPSRSVRQRGVQRVQRFDRLCCAQVFRSLDATDATTSARWLEIDRDGLVRTAPPGTIERGECRRAAASRLLLLGLLVEGAVVEVVGRAELLLVLDEGERVEEHGDAHICQDVAVEDAALHGTSSRSAAICMRMPSAPKTPNQKTQYKVGRIRTPTINSPSVRAHRIH